MAITNNGTLIEITGTEVGISGLAGGAGVTVEGDVYTVGSPITEFRITGDLTVSDYETLQIDDAVRFSRPAGGVLTMKPFSKIEIIGLARGADLINNTFRGGFTFNAEILELGDGRIQSPVFREAPAGRSDCFSCYSPDFTSGTGGPVVFNVDGLTLIYEPVTSAKIYASASSLLNNIHLKRFGGNFVELQVGFNNGAETKTFDKLIFDNIEQISTIGGATQAGSLFLLTSPRFLFDTDFTISLINLRSDVEYIELRDIQSIGSGQWDGTITNIFRGIRTTSTQKRFYLSGSTPVSGIKTVYTPTGSIGSEVSDLSNSEGLSEQVLVYGESEPRVDFFTGVIPQETWTVVAVGYNQRIAGGSFRLLDNASPETLDQSLQVVNAPVNEIDKSVVDAYTEIQNANQLHDASVAFVVDNPVGLSDWLLTQSGNTIDAGIFNLSIDALAESTFAFDGATITINSSVFTGNITTTGTVTLLNGATVSGGIVDSNGDSFLTFLGVDSWEVYPTQNDANLQSNALDSGVSGEVFRFNFVPATTYYLRLTVGDDTLFKTTTPIVSGETEVSLTQAGILTSIQATTANIDTQLGFVERAIFVDDSLPNGNGSSGLPFSNMEDAIAKARVDEIRTILATGEFTLASSIAGLTIESIGVLDIKFGGQDITGATLRNCVLSGTASGNTITVFNSILGYDTATQMPASIAMPQGFYYESNVLSFTGTTPGNYSFFDCASGVAGNSAPIVSCTPAVGTQFVQFRRWSGGLDLRDIDLQDIVSVDAVSGGTVTINGTGGSASIRGILKEVIDNSGGAVSVNTDAVLNNLILNTTAEQDIRQTALIAEHDSTQAQISALNNFDPAIDQVIVATNNDKTGYSINGTKTTLDALNDLSSADVTAAVPSTAQIEAALLNEGDGQQLIDAIVQAIGNENIDQALLVAAIRADLERTGGLLDNLPTLSEIEASTILAKTSDIAGLNDITAADVWISATRTITGGQVDTIAGTIQTLDALDSAQDTQHSNTQALITALNNISEAQVNAQVDLALSDYDAPTKAELDLVESALLSAISGLNDLDAAQVAQGVWNYLQSETTIGGSLKEAIEVTLRRSGLIPAAL